jgi:nucleoside 2-deoxyribosyltransferase
MRVYLAGPLFTEAERAWLDALAARLRADGFECFVPHEAFREQAELTPADVFRVDGAGLHEADVLVAWLDGPSVDDGTACEIGIFAELVRNDPARHRGIVGVATDLRTDRRRRRHVPGDGMNLFVVGAIESCGSIVTSADELVVELRRLQ